jgi:hypothetical protein
MRFVRGRRLSRDLAHADLSKVSFEDDEIGLNNKLRTHLKEEKRRDVGPWTHGGTDGERPLQAGNLE